MQDLTLQFQYIVATLRGMKLTFLHSANSKWINDIASDGETNHVFVRLWNNISPVVLEGGYDEKPARAEIDAFGRLFLANPDLPFRTKKGIAFQDYDRQCFYTALQSPSRVI